MSNKSGMGWVVAGFAALALAASMGAGAAEKCRDASGKFMKCPPAQTTTQGAHCRDKTTKKFAKCGGPNTEPVPSTSAK
jgi:hypothetical protein